MSRPISVIFPVFIIAACLYQASSVFGEEWTSPQFSGGLIYYDGSVLTGQSIDRQARDIHAGDTAYAWARFKLRVSVHGRVDEGRSYFSNIDIKIVPDYFLRDYGETTGAGFAEYKNSPTRVIVERISFLTLGEGNNRLGTLHVINLPHAAVDSAATSAGEEYIQNVALDQEICVPGGVILNVVCKAGASGSNELIVPYFLRGSESQSFRWQMEIPGPAPQPAFPADYDENVFFGYIYSAGDGLPLHGVDIRLRDYGFVDSGRRGYDTSDEYGYFEIRFKTAINKQRTYKVYIGGDDDEPSVIQDYYGNYYYEEQKRIDRIPRAENVPVIFMLEKKRPPAAMITAIDPEIPNEGQEVRFTGRGFAKREEIRSYQWHSDVDGYLSGSRVFTTYDLSAGVDHTISFSCTDGHGFTSPKDRRIVRINRKPRANIYSMEPNPASEGDTVSFRIDAFDDDPEGKIKKIKCWARRIDGEESRFDLMYEGEPDVRVDDVDEGQPAQASFEYTFSKEGEYEIVATACDDLGAWASDPDGNTQVPEDEYGEFQGDIKELVVGPPVPEPESVFEEPSD